MVHIWDWNIYSYDMNLKRVTEIIDSHDIAYYSQFGQKYFFPSVLDQILMLYICFRNMELEYIML